MSEPRDAPASAPPVVELEMRFTFRAEHALELPNGRKEPRHHHDYLLIVCVRRPLDNLGFVVENHALDDVVRAYVIRRISGAWLHDVLEQPTMERLAVWVWERLRDQLPGLIAVSISEQKAHGAMATYRGV